MRQASLPALLVALAAADGAFAQSGAGQGEQVFARACIACHSLEPDRNMTGPSLSGLWGRKAGSLPSFARYSPALKQADMVWGDDTLDPWLKDPQAFIPGNHMVFPGIQEDQVRADLIAFLKDATTPGAETAQGTPMQGMMGMGGDVPNLKEAPPHSQVKTITYCNDTYTITLGDGETAQFWERNLRFKTDSSEDGPTKGAPAIIGAGMMGDRASVIFAAPEEMGPFIKRQC
jgi:cytochrome c